MNKIIFWVIALIAIAAVLFGLYTVGKGTGEPDIGTWYEEQSRDHIAIGAEHDAYNSNPPTSGPHYEESAKTGIYDKELPDEQLVHNLEHSHIWITYKPASVSAEALESLVGITKKTGSKIILTPRSANDSPIAILAWQRILKMDTLDEAMIEKFIRRYRGVAGPPEERLVPDFGFGDHRSQ